MNPNEYQKLALTTESNPIDFFLNIEEKLTTIPRLLHASLGLASEVGEFQDQLKKHLAYGQDLNIQNLKEELGDILWYVALACNTLAIPMEVVMEMNIEKLRARYPEKFKFYDAEQEHRDLNNELNKMQQVEDEAQEKFKGI